MDLDYRVVTAEDLPLLRQLYALMDGEDPLLIETVEQLLADISAVPNYDIK